ncbi:substrate-binding periplasmic protein [Marinobacter adhaerens]|uniref:substrate-binding periplasmic protein n=1 Tax=Marinobacter adhaerens TaxID=1033846 RepID=UPI003D27B269
MKVLPGVFTGFLLTFSALMFFAESASAEGRAQLRFCEDPWAPYTLGEIDSVPEGGIAVELFKELGERLDVDFQLRLLPWKRCLLWAETGDYDGVMLLTRNDERAAYLTFTDSVHEDKNLVWHQADRRFDHSFENFADFKGVRIGVTAGFNYGEKFNQAVEEFDLVVEEAPNILSNLRRLDLGRIDVFLVNKPAAEFSMVEFPDLRERLTYANGPFEALPFYIGLSKASPVIFELERFNQAIAHMRDEGTLERIFSAQPVP